jgi:Fe-S cluster assembly ATP-binding protein
MSTRVLSPKNSSLSFDNVSVSVGETPILHDISHVFEKHTPTALTGANGSGKSTLAKLFLGTPQLSITRGTVSLNQASCPNFFALDAHQRALHGLFTVWQHPPIVHGVRLGLLLRESLNAHRVFLGQTPLDPYDFEDVVVPFLEQMKLPRSWLERTLDGTFSGGERKRNELLQMLLLSPEWIVCDEIDAGMDVATVELTAQMLTLAVNRGCGLLVVSHHPDFLSKLPIAQTLHMAAGHLAIQSA